MEAPYVLIDALLAAFAQRHGYELYRNYRGADRCLRFNDALSRAIWVHATDKYGAQGTYHVSVVAHQDRPERYMKGATIAEAVAPGDLDRVLEDAAQVVASWSEHDLELVGIPPSHDGSDGRVHSMAVSSLGNRGSDPRGERRLPRHRRTGGRSPIDLRGGVTGFAFCHPCLPSVV